MKKAKFRVGQVVKVVRDAPFSADYGVIVQKAKGSDGYYYRLDGWSNGSKESRFHPLNKRERGKD